MPVLTIASGSLGILTNKIIDIRKSKKIKEIDIKENEELKIRYQVKKQEYENKNIILNNMLEKLENQRRILSDISKEYLFIDKNNFIKHDEKDLLNKITNIKQDIENKYNNLNKLTELKIIKGEFYNIHNRIDRKYKRVGIPLIFGIILLFSYGYTNNLLCDLVYANFSNIYYLVNLIVPFSIGSITSLAYGIKNDNKKEKLYNKLIEKIDYQKNKNVNLNKEIEDKINDISNNEYKLIEYKNMKENLQSNKDNKKGIKYKKELDNKPIYIDLDKNKINDQVKNIKFY